MRGRKTNTITRLVYYIGFTGCTTLALASHSDAQLSETRSYDGINNNLAFPEWGAANTARIRAYPQQYSFYDGRDEPLDEVNSNLPSARRIMEKIFHKVKPFKDKTVSHTLLEFGHFIVQDILGSRYNFSDSFDIPCDGELTDYVYCPVTGIRVEIDRSSVGGFPEDNATNRFEEFHPGSHNRISINNSTKPTMEFHRDEHVHNSHSNPRATVNGMTSFLDLSNLYGVTRGDMLDFEVMREDRGKLALTKDGLLEDIDDFHQDLKAGVESSPGAYAIYIVFMRYHNLVAEEHYNSTPDASDEEIFEYARRQTIAVYQSFVEEKYIPTLLGDKLDPYDGYDETVDPSIDEFFAAVAFRYAHSSFSHVIRVLDESYQPTSIDPLLIRDVFKNNVPGLIKEQGGIEPFLRGLTITPAKEVDASMVEDFNIWADATSILDVQRGRDVGIPRYNNVREAFNLTRMASMEELVSDRYKKYHGDNYHTLSDYVYLVDALKELYHDDVDRVDAYVGALIEAPLTDLDNLGPLMAKSIKHQFTRLRDGDRFWYKKLYEPAEYENFPDLSELIKMVCKDMDLFPSDPYVMANPSGGDLESGGDDGVCNTGGSATQLSLLGGDFTVRWEFDETDPVQTTIDVTLSIQEPMEGPGYLGIGWEELAMKGAHIWFCTVDNDSLQAYLPLPSDCTAPNATSPSPMFSCCLAPGTYHEKPLCSKSSDDLFYSLEITDWCISSETSSVTVRAPVCNNDETVAIDSGSEKRNCFRTVSTEDGAMDFIVAYNRVANSRPHGYQRRTNAQIDLTAGVFTQEEASTADDGLIATHGAFMLFGWLGLAPWGVFIVRYMKTWKRRLVAHISIMGVVGSMMVPLLIGVEASVGATDKTNQHAVVGLIVMTLFFAMAGTGRFRYLKWEGHKIGKKTDFITLVFHKYGGAVFIGLAWWNCYTGLCRISPEDSEFQLVIFSNLHIGYDIHAFGTFRDYVYGPYIAFVALVFILAEIRQIKLADASQNALKSGKGLWGDDDDSHLDTMTLETFLDVTRLGNALCVVDGRVLDITNFIDTHPGGPELLRYVRGSDITSEFVGHRDVDGIQHVHSHGALMLMKKFVKAKLIESPDGQLPQGRGSTVPGLRHSIVKEAGRSLSQPFRRGKVFDVRYLAPSASAEGEHKPVILLRLALPRTKERLQEKKVTKLPGCSFRFRGIDKRGLMFEREYTAVYLDRHGSKDAPLSKFDALVGQQISLKQLDVLVGSSSSLVPQEDDNEKDEIYDFIISLIPGGQMSEFFLGLKTGKLLLAQGPKVAPKTLYKAESEKWKSVVMLAGGTGITSMLQIIDYYLEEQKGYGHCPFLYLVWVLKSPGHNYHSSLGLRERIRKSKGRLRWITVYSVSCEDVAESERAPEESLPSPAPAATFCKSLAPRRTVSAPSRARRPATVPVFKSRPKRSVSYEDEGQARQEDSERLSGARASVFSRPSAFAQSIRPSAFAQNLRQGNLPSLYWMKNRTRLNVRDLISFVRDDGFNADDVDLLGTDKRVKLEGSFWNKTPRQMTRHLDEGMMKELLHSMRAFTSQYRTQQGEHEDFSNSLTSLQSASDEPTDIASFLRKYVPTGDHNTGTRLHKDCFVASEAIDYLVSFGHASSREHAVQLGRELQERQIIKHVSVGCAFSDDSECFRFVKAAENDYVASSQLSTIGESEIDLSIGNNGNDIDYVFGSSQGQPHTPGQSEPAPGDRRGLERSDGELQMEEDVEEAPSGKRYKGMLVAVSGSPMFEHGMITMLEAVGVPREQILTFVAPMK